MAKGRISILFPDINDVQYKELTSTTLHDLGLDAIVKKLSPKESEQKLILNVLARITDSKEVANYRSDVYEDIVKVPALREQMLELLEQVQSLRDSSSMSKDPDRKAGMWELLHRLDEINDYILCVIKMRECLNNPDIKSKGLTDLKNFLDSIYEEAAFEEMRKDISNLKADASSLQSITVGINLNERFEATGFGLISVNSKPFKHSGIVTNFSNAINSNKGIKNDTTWNGDMHYQPIEENKGHGFMDTINTFGSFAAIRSTPLMDANVRNSAMSTIVNAPSKDSSSAITSYMDKTVNSMLSVMVKRLREILSKYVAITIHDVTNLIPEFIYYIRFAEWYEELIKANNKFCKPVAVDDGKLMEAKGIYNLKLAAFGEKAEAIVTNDLDFDDEHLVYILTGANRGGKTTITQAIGLLYVLAQGGLYVPGDEFRYVPVDAVFTHFPADEDKTMDLGRLGEECTRFKTMYSQATNKSLMLLNETFSTTSFEEGYYIAKDSVIAIQVKGVRTIYNTHMHKLGEAIDEMNAHEVKGKSASLIMQSDGGQRSYKVCMAPPEGNSYANDIARKYGVTLDMLLE